MRTLLRLGVGAFALLSAGSASAQADIFSAETLHGFADLRLAASEAETSWLDGGFGKTTESGGVRGRLSEVALDWRPRFNFAVGAVVTAEYQPRVSPSLDIGEAFLRLQAPPTEFGRISGRVGIMYPPVSMEHDGTAWTNPDMLSSSAINSWIGEEVKVAGAEITFQRPLGDSQVALTGGVFGWNDTSGTLLSFRGWSLHGVKAGASTAYELPPLSPFMATRQGDETYPFLELDHRAGWYGRVEWRPPAPVSFNATYYDNAGDRTAVDGEQQWAWETRFLNVGAKWDVADGTRVLAQAMNGETLMGYRRAGALWVDVGYSAAYVLVQHQFGEADKLSARLDAFATRDRTLRALDDNTEHGLALAAAWRRRVSPHVELITEGLVVDSYRPARSLDGDGAKQTEATLQTALRLTF